MLLKDSIATKDKLNMKVGSFALLGSVVAKDATVVEKLRSVEAVILGKATLTEWFGVRSLLIPNGWCARGGQGVVCTFFFLVNSFELSCFLFSYT